MVASNKRWLAISELRRITRSSVSAKSGSDGSRAAAARQRLPRLIPLGRALEMLYTGKRIDAQEALRLGLVDYVVPMPELISRCEQIASEICKSAPLAVQRIKEVALRGLDLPLAEGLKLEHDRYDSLTKTEDAKEGAQAFAEKRSPTWKGK